MKYLFFLNTPPGWQPAEPGSPEQVALYSAYREATQAMAEAGVLIDCAPLQPPSAATTVRVRDGQTLLTDGPAAEIKEHVGGYTIVECANLDEALKWAATIPAAWDASIEVRPIIAVEVPA